MRAPSRMSSPQRGCDADPACGRQRCSLPYSPQLPSRRAGRVGDDANSRCRSRRGRARRDQAPFGDPRQACATSCPGEIVGVEIERKKGRWLYEFRRVTGQGQLFEVYVTPARRDRTDQGEVMRVLLVEDDRRIASDVVPRLGCRLCRRDGARRRGGLVPRRHRGLRRDHPRSRLAANGRPLGAEALARQWTRDPGAHLHRTRQLDGARRRHRRGSRRLSAEAVPDGGAAGTSARDRPPVRGQASSVLSAGDVTLDERQKTRHRARRAGRLSPLEYRLVAYL